MRLLALVCLAESHLSPQNRNLGGKCGVFNGNFFIGIGVFEIHANCEHVNHDGSLWILPRNVTRIHMIFRKS